MAQLLYSGPTTLRSVFSNTDAHPLLIDLALIRTFKSDYLQWEPETVWMEIQKTFGTSISEVNKSKIQALRTAHLVSFPYEQWEIFEKMAIAFNGGIPMFSMVQQPSPHACAFAVTVLSQIKTHTLSDEVEKYIACVCLDNGVVTAPSPIEIANQHIKKLLEPKGRAVALKVKATLAAGKSPHLDSAREEDIQLAKTLSIVDYNTFMEKRLYSQLKYVFKGDK